MKSEYRPRHSAVGKIRAPQLPARNGQMGAPQVPASNSQISSGSLPGGEGGCLVGPTISQALNADCQKI